MRVRCEGGPSVSSIIQKLQMNFGEIFGTIWIGGFGLETSLLGKNMR